MGVLSGSTEKTAGNYMCALPLGMIAFTRRICSGIGHRKGSGSGRPYGAHVLDTGLSSSMEVGRSKAWVERAVSNRELVVAVALASILMMVASGVYELLTGVYGEVLGLGLLCGEPL